MLMDGNLTQEEINRLPFPLIRLQMLADDEPKTLPAIPPNNKSFNNPIYLIYVIFPFRQL